MYRIIKEKNGFYTLCEVVLEDGEIKDSYQIFSGSSKNDIIRQMKNALKDVKERKVIVL